MKCFLSDFSFFLLSNLQEIQEAIRVRKARKFKKKMQIKVKMHKNAPAKIVLLHIGPFNPLEVSHAWSLVKAQAKVILVRPRSNQMAFCYFWSCLTKIHGDTM